MTDRHDIMSAEMSPEVYAGETCDEIEPKWVGWAEGDKDAPGPVGVDGVLLLDAKTFPPGTKISITVPLCPSCHLQSELCDCGFDWDKWTRETYA